MVAWTVVPHAANWRVGLVALVVAMSGMARAEVPDFALHARHMVLIDEATGAVLMSKGAQESVPMASLTKLLTAMVVLDAGQDLHELLTIDTGDLDTLKHTVSGLPVGATLRRDKLLELALLASDNHAASSLARHYPGGMAAFLAAVRLKASGLGLASTHVLEPTGLSPDNRSSASDMAIVVRTAADYPAIAAATTQTRGDAVVKGKPYHALNTNRLVGSPGWDILLSKTGFTNEAGRCIAMRLRTAGKTVFLVLLNASEGAGRTLDAVNVTRWLAGLTPVMARPLAALEPRSKRTLRGAPRGLRQTKLA